MMAILFQVCEAIRWKDSHNFESYAIACKSD
jgi:hypothetical protein